MWHVERLSNVCTYELQVMVNTRFFLVNSKGSHILRACILLAAQCAPGTAFCAQIIVRLRAPRGAAAGHLVFCS